MESTPSKESANHHSANGEDKSAAALCNFVFPKFLGTTDPVDALLQEHADDLVASPDQLRTGATTSSSAVKDWELQEAILGQYLIFDEDEDNFEAV